MFVELVSCSKYLFFTLDLFIMGRKLRNLALADFAQALIRLGQGSNGPLLEHIALRHWVVTAGLLQTQRQQYMENQISTFFESSNISATVRLT